MRYKWSSRCATLPKPHIWLGTDSVFYLYTTMTFHMKNTTAEKLFSVSCTKLKKDFFDLFCFSFSSFYERGNRMKR